MIKIIHRPDYLLLLSNDPCQLFKFFNVESMHGLSLNECKAYKNTENDAYIAGLCNYIPNENNVYELNDECFVYINVSRCTNDVETVKLLFHEFMHMALKKFQWNLHHEEKLITWAENETSEILPKVNEFKKTL